MKNNVKTVDEYIANYPAPVQEILNTLRHKVRQAAPDATERISYGIPTYWLGRNIVHFGAYPNHIGVYPGPDAIRHFADELQGYETSKGTIKFLLTDPVPYDLVAKITSYNLSRLHK
jgi:uncharacterized protein YdhG (YjbR/CyaY superfamily)